MSRYTAYYNKADEDGDSAFFVSKAIIVDGPLVELNDDEALRKARAAVKMWKSVTLRQLDRHVTVYEAGEEG